MALSDGLLDEVERKVLISFVDLQGFVPTFSQREIAEAFDISVRQIRCGGRAPLWKRFVRWPACLWHR